VGEVSSRRSSVSTLHMKQNNLAEFFILLDRMRAREIEETSAGLGSSRMT
jgi:hypothetical protein